MKSTLLILKLVFMNSANVCETLLLFEKFFNLVKRIHYLNFSLK